jgi:trigger factor
MTVSTVDIQIEVEKPAAWTRRLTITVPAARLQQERHAAVQKLARQVRLPGFRKGKVPTRIMEQRFGQAIEQETLEKVMGDAYREAIQREGLQPISQGSIDNIEYAAGTDLTFHVGFDVRPEIELERLGGFELQRPPVEVGDDQLDQVLERLRDEQAVWGPVDDTPVAGDMVKVEITPLDGEHVGQPRGYELVIGEGQALPAIEDAIRTLRAGAAEEFNVDLPEDVDDPAAGTKAHHIRVHLQEVKRPVRPELDDTFAQSLGSFEDLATLRARIREDLEREAVKEADRNVRQQLIMQVAEANPFEVPESMTQQYLERAMPARKGVEDEQLEQMRQSAWPAAEHAIRRILIVERVAELEGLRATPLEIEERLASVAGMLGRPVDEVRGQLQKNGRIQEIEEEITDEKVFEYLLSLSTVR